MKLFLVLALLFSTRAFADVQPQKILNRSVLTVGHDFYTAFDAYAIVAAFQFVHDEKIAFKVDWFSPPKFSVITGDNVFEAIRDYPSDAQDLIFVTFVWNEVKRLNLFETSTKEIEEWVHKFRAANISYVTPVTVREYLQTCSPVTLSHYFEMALRAATYRRMRGSGAKSKQPSTMSWFWHDNRAAK